LHPKAERLSVGINVRYAPEADVRLGVFGDVRKVASPVRIPRKIEASALPAIEEIGRQGEHEAKSDDGE